MQRRAISQITSISRPIPTFSATSATIVAPASVPPPTLATTQPPPVSTVIVTSTLAPTPVPVPATTTLPIIPTATAVYTTVTQVLTTTPNSSPGLPTGLTISTPGGTTSSNFFTTIETTSAQYTPTRSSSFSRSSSARASASSLQSSSPSSHKPSSNVVGKYVGYAIGAVFFLTLISSFISAYRKHRKFVKKRPRGSTFIGARLSDGQNSTRKMSMAQALMRSVSNRSFDAYALSDTPPTSPAPVYLGGNQHSHSDVLNRARGFSTSPIHTRPLPPTPSPKYTTHEEDPFFFPHVPPADPHEHSHSPFGVSSSGSSTQTSTDPRWPLGDR
ncbi:hypothetical protein DFH07DRAFT_249708 [Mycena maculata]|uniref:Transmembrane protein n=1 Tax=Mycena maculata TaxID=230809 RepID=A0AAD7MPY3_9AGAR|nr:hypothetical protein DFH07DRAFT_249708 [Mycena maculata]